MDPIHLRYGLIVARQAHDLPEEDPGRISAWPIVEAWFADHPQGTVSEFTEWVTETADVPWDRVLTIEEQERLATLISPDEAFSDFINCGLSNYP